MAPGPSSHLHSQPRLVESSPCPLSAPPSPAPLFHVLGPWGLHRAPRTPDTPARSLSGSQLAGWPCPLRIAAFALSGLPKGKNTTAPMAQVRTSRPPDAKPLAPGWSPQPHPESHKFQKLGFRPTDVRSQSLCLLRHHAVPATLVICIIAIIGDGPLLRGHQPPGFTSELSR